MTTTTATAPILTLAEVQNGDTLTSLKSGKTYLAYGAEISGTYDLAGNLIGEAGAPYVRYTALRAGKEFGPVRYLYSLKGWSITRAAAEGR